jgi:hypothetical protein
MHTKMKQRKIHLTNFFGLNMIKTNSFSRCFPKTKDDELEILVQYVLWSSNVKAT